MRGDVADWSASVELSTAVVDARLQSARDQFEARLAAIKHDLLLGQAELARPLCVMSRA